MDIREVTTSAAGIALAVEVVSSSVHEAWSAARDAHIVISGGRSGAALASAISSALDDFAAGVLHLWIADERYVAVDDGDRNDAAIIEALPADAPHLHVHRHLAPGQASAEHAAAAYAGELEALLGTLPFDAIVLSAGEDGHVASVFPRHLQPPETVYVEWDSPKPPSVRTTISLARLSNTRHCIVLALGTSKAAAVQDIVLGDMTLPARQLATLTKMTLVTDALSGISAGLSAVDSVN